MTISNAIHLTSWMSALMSVLMAMENAVEWKGNPWFDIVERWQVWSYYYEVECGHQQITLKCFAPLFVLSPKETYPYQESRRVTEIRMPCNDQNFTFYLPFRVRLCGVTSLSKLFLYAYTTFTWVCVYIYIYISFFISHPGNTADVVLVICIKWIKSSIELLNWWTALSWRWTLNRYHRATILPAPQFCVQRQFSQHFEY